MTQLFATLGYSPGTVRLMLSRAVRDGQFLRVKSGKTVYYSPCPHKAREIDNMGNWAFLQDNDASWDGRWYLLSYQVPDECREIRERLRVRLAKMGFGRLGYSLWIAPHDKESALSCVAEELSLTERIITFKAVPSNLSPAEIAARAWCLPKIADRYQQLLRVFETIENALPDPPDGKQAFAAIWEACVHFVMTVNEDPRLPMELLPPDWPGQRAAAHYKRLEERLYPRAKQFFQSVACFYPD